jgi:hypothetical protein
VAQLVEALHYKPEGHGFDSRWVHWNFILDFILPAALWFSGRLSPGMFPGVVKAAGA